jgi:hypothetical protein
MQLSRSMALLISISCIPHPLYSAALPVAAAADPAPLANQDEIMAIIEQLAYLQEELATNETALKQKRQHVEALVAQQTKEIQQAEQTAQKNKKQLPEADWNLAEPTQKENADIKEQENKIEALRKNIEVFTQLLDKTAAALVLGVKDNTQAFLNNKKHLDETKKQRIALDRVVKTIDQEKKTTKQKEQEEKEARKSVAQQQGIVSVQEQERQQDDALIDADSLEALVNEARKQSRTSQQSRRSQQ